MSNTKKSFSVSFTLSESDAAIALFNIATKAAGLEVAEIALHLSGKLRTAYENASKLAEEPGAAV